MAAKASPVHFVMVDRAVSHRTPAGREFLMAGVTHGTGTDMGRRLTAGVGAVVAGEAVAGEAGMIRRGASGYGKPGTGDMTTITFRRGHQVIDPFASGQGTVMTL